MGINLALFQRLREYDVLERDRSFIRALSKRINSDVGGGDRAVISICAFNVVNDFITRAERAHASTCEIVGIPVSFDVVKQFLFGATEHKLLEKRLMRFCESKIGCTLCGTSVES